MTITDLASQLGRIEHFVVGQGPDHPTNPSTTYAAVMEEFFAEYPCLQSHLDYVEFFRRYVGASCDYPDYYSLDYVCLSLYGFDGNISGGLDSDDPPLIDDKGFYVFCESNHRVELHEDINAGCVYFGFGFNANAPLDTRVYVIAQYPGEDHFRPWVPYFNNFTDWLTQLISCRGRFEFLTKQVLYGP